MDKLYGFSDRHWLCFVIFTSRAHLSFSPKKVIAPKRSFGAALAAEGYQGRAGTGNSLNGTWRAVRELNQWDIGYRIL